MRTRKIVLAAIALCAVFAVSLPAAPGDIDLGLTLGYGFLLNPPPYLPGVDDASGGFQFEVKGQYFLAENFLFGGDFLVGALTGFMMTNRYTDTSGDYGRGDIPLVAFGQLEFGPVYALIGFGVHFWTGDGVGMDFGMTYGGGYVFELTEELALDAGLRLHTVFADNAMMLNCSVGVVYSF